MADKESPERDTTVADPAQSIKIGTIGFSAERDQIVTAMFAVQEALSSVPHDSVGEVYKNGKLAYKYNYTSFPLLLRELVPVMHEHELLLVFGAGGSEVMGVTACAMHKDGQWAQTTVPMVTSGAGTAVGSAMSFGKRYAVLALFGLATEDDDAKIATESIAPAAPAVTRDMLVALPKTHQEMLTELDWKMPKACGFLAKYVSDGVLDEQGALVGLSRALDRKNEEAGR